VQSEVLKLLTDVQAMQVSRKQALCVTCDAVCTSRGLSLSRLLQPLVMLLQDCGQQSFL
jgi:hypothetical protein